MLPTPMMIGGKQIPESERKREPLKFDKFGVLITK
jgi:hypothetical protein